MCSILCLMLATASPAMGSSPQRIVVFDSAAIQYDPAMDAPASRGAYTVRRNGQTVERTLELPLAPFDQRDARRIIATIQVEPRLITTEAGYKPGDPWPRLGSVSVVEGETEIEVMRFITPFGGAATYRADLTALAPLLHGTQTFRLTISTYMTTGWDATFSLEYAEAAGQRRPIFARSVFNEENVTSDSNALRSNVTIPHGLDRPRLRILTTGHATDGSGGDEFITRTHVLRINGEEVARWRPWAERGGSLRELNPPPLGGARRLAARTQPRKRTPEHRRPRTLVERPRSQQLASRRDHLAAHHSTSGTHTR